MSVDKVVHLTLDKREFVALVAAANLGVFFAQGSGLDAHEAGRLLFDATQRALDQLGADGWHTLLDQVAKLGDAAFPELTALEGSFLARQQRRKR